MSDYQSDEWSTPKLIGAGDGQKPPLSSTKKRTVIPARKKVIKANIKSPVENKICLKLEKDLEKCYSLVKDVKTTTKSPSLLKKATSIAEITPTKSKPKRCINNNENRKAAVALHVTPRPLDDVQTPTTSTSGRCPRSKAVCSVYQKLLLCVWRRSKMRLSSLAESYRRQQDQIAQFEMQVDVLKKLRESECEKRNQAIANFNQVSREYELLQQENSSLSGKIVTMELELLNYKNDLQMTKYELRIYDEKMARIQEKLKMKKDEVVNLQEKISKQEHQINLLKTNFNHLESRLRDTERNLQNTDSSFKNKIDECENLKTQLKMKTEQCTSLQGDIDLLNLDKRNLLDQLKHLKDQLLINDESLCELEEENDNLKNNLENTLKELEEEKHKSFWKYTSQLAGFTCKSLNQVAYLILPTYRILTKD